ncbi:MAG: caspase family protein, partial [Rubrivivax sp.]
MVIVARPVAAAWLAGVVLAAGGPASGDARGSEVLAAACRGGAPAEEPCRGALEQAAADDALALAEQWVASKRYAPALQVLEQLRRRQPWNTRFAQRLHEVRSLAEEAAWLARRGEGAAPPIAAAPAAETAPLAAAPFATEADLALVETRCTRLAGEAALAACDQVLAVRPRDARILAARGDLLLTLNRAAEAVVAYRAAAAQAPSAALAQKIALAEAIVRPAPLALDQQLLALARAQDQGLISRAEYERQRAALLQPPGPVAVAGSAAGAPLDAAAFGRFHALVIGNNAYRHLDRLETAVNDARAIGDVLRAHYAFDVRLLTDATRADIVEVLDEYRSRLEPA